MPFPLALPIEFSDIPKVQQVQKAGNQEFGEEFQVTGKVEEIDPVRQIVVYSEGVVGKYGPTFVFADRLELHHAEKFAILRGNVRIEDPEGVIKAQSAIFWYGPTKGPDGQIAVADHVELELAGVTARAESAVIKQGRWEFLNVEATNCRQPLPFYVLKSKKVVILPGRSGTLYSPKLTILGQRLPTLPTRRFSLDRRDPGFQLPAVAYKPGSGFGVSWASGMLIDDQSLVEASLSSFPDDLPSYSAKYIRSYLPADISSRRIEARSDLSERFAWSWFDNVKVQLYKGSAGFASRKRHSLTMQTVWNTGASARPGEDETFSKLLDVAYEKSGGFEGFGLFGQVRAQSIRRGNEEFIQRGVFQGTVQVPPVQMAKGLMSDVRFDMYGIAGKNAFGWARVQAGAVYQPIPQLMLGGAYVVGGETGTPDYNADRLFSTHAMHLRGDLNLGPTKLSYLAKFDFNRKTWYDKEYSISQVVGCLEPYLVRREFPRSYALGIRFRWDDFLDVLERRKQVRTKPVAPQTISRMPDKP
jgi:hypothetical protein